MLKSFMFLASFSGAHQGLIDCLISYICLSTRDGSQLNIIIKKGIHGKWRVERCVAKNGGVRMFTAHSSRCMDLFSFLQFYIAVLEYSVYSMHFTFKTSC